RRAARRNLASRIGGCGLKNTKREGKRQRPVGFNSTLRLGRLRLTAGGAEGARRNSEFQMSELPLRFLSWGKLSRRPPQGNFAQPLEGKFAVTARGMWKTERNAGFRERARVERPLLSCGTVSFADFRFPW